MIRPEMIKRREFLEATTGLLAGVVVAGSPLSAFAAGRAWAVDLRAFSSAEGATLTAVARTICPHDKLDDSAYALVVKALDDEAVKDEKSRDLFVKGAAELGPAFAAAGEEARVAALKGLESSAFFQTMRLRTLQLLYASPIAYAYFGYEGEAYSKGGYLLRGFNDLRWLPEIPEEDSGPLPVRA
ncbi:MAG TPA: hypothetical protein VNH19_00030 [Candidatus Limnocylindrales bacterium]|nr:hypothetical protein [Candidatus Limnocylindrales bacterium]